MQVTNIKVYNLMEALEGAGMPFSKGKPLDSTLVNLANAKQRSNSKFLRQCLISFNITAPLYWLSEFDTYRIGVTRMSTSTMHTLLKQKLTIGDFEYENDVISMRLYSATKYSIIKIIERIEEIKELHSDSSDTDLLIAIKKILPSSFKYTSHITMNYEVLRTMYHDRINHRLIEWKVFLDSFKDIPYFNEFIVGDKKC